ncbi:MAG TPA: phage tail protein [Gemmatimonadales bacterium]|nr:phage tail protein [Gemmatimonadales bacterium]
MVTDAATNTKHLAGVEYEEISAQVGIGTKSPLLDWVAQSWKGTALRKSGSIVDLDIDYRAVAEREFKDALITQTTIPTLDVASRDAASFTVKLAPTSIRQSAGSGTILKSTVGTQKNWLVSNFRFEMDGLDGKGVAHIESFSVGQPAATDNVGETRDYEKQTGKLVFPNLKISLNQSSASTWSQWFNDFVVMGNNGDDREKKGGIVFLDPYLKELGRINLFNCGIFRLAPAKAVATDAIKRVTAELYCERMELAVF